MSNGRRISVLHAWGGGEGTDQLYWMVKDDALIQQIGWVEDDWEDTSITDFATLQQKAQAEFDRRKNPFTEAAVRVPAGVLPADLAIGDVVTLIDPISGTVAALPVQEIDIEEDPDTGEVYTLGLNTQLVDIMDEILKGRRLPTGIKPPEPLKAPTLRAEGRFEEVALSWTLVPSAEGYDLEHSTDGATWENLVSGAAALKYNHQGLIFGSGHHYRVFAKRGGKRSGASNVVYAQARDTTPPSVPTGLSVTTPAPKIARLEWERNPESDVVEYRVYRKPGNYPSDPSGAARIADEAGTVHTDATGDYGQEYTWYLSAVDRSENESDLSTGVVATIKQTGSGDVDATAPASLAGITLSVSEQVLYQDAQGNWYVRAKLSLSGIPADAKRAFVQIKHRRQGSTTYSLDDQLYAPSGSATAYVDDLLPNVAYEYAAVPVSHFGIEGTGKTASATAPKDTQPPAVPTGLVVESHKLGVKARWNANTEPDLTGYRVQYRLGGGAWTTVFVGADTERLVQADPGVLVEFQLRAEDTSENVSAYSAIEGATAQALGGEDYAPGSVQTIHVAQGAITALEVIEINDATGTGTSSTSFVDIPGYSITFTLTESASCIINMSLWAACENEDFEDGSETVFAWFRTLLDGAELSASRRTIGVMAPRYDPEFGDYRPLGVYGSVAYNATRLLQAGQHTIKAQFHQLGGEHVTVYHRVLSVTIFKR